MEIPKGLTAEQRTEFLNGHSLTPEEQQQFNLLYGRGAKTETGGGLSTRHESGKPKFSNPDRLVENEGDAYAELKQAWTASQDRIRDLEQTNNELHHNMKSLQADYELIKKANENGHDINTLRNENRKHVKNMESTDKWKAMVEILAQWHNQLTFPSNGLPFIDGPIDQELITATVNATSKPDA